tara:strand:+ start:837 stop:1151 length:315 start_codon:yes stop_codon:yes gene_type:complete
MYKWPDKDKDEILDYSIDWSRFLADDTVSGATWYITGSDGVKTEVADAGVVDGLQRVSATYTITVTTIRLSLGTNNRRYLLTCKVTTVEGLQYERSVYLRIKEK